MGELEGISPNGAPVLVAVKTLKENATPKPRQDFHREVELMTDLRHSNIVCLIGVIMREEPMCMIFEHMSQVKSCWSRFFSELNDLYSIELVIL